MIKYNLGGRIMKKNILAIGITTLFVLSMVSPFVFGNTIRISNKEMQQLKKLSEHGLMDSAWPMFQHDVCHTGRSPYGKSGNWFVEKWNKELGDILYSSPAIDKNGIIYIGGLNKYFYAINPNGTLKWRYEAGGPIASSPAIAEDGTIFVGSEDTKLYAFNPNGTKKWALTIGDGWVESSPVIDEDGIIYIGSVNGNNICAVYPNGTKKWDTKLGGLVYYSAGLDDNGTGYIGCNDGYMYAFYCINGSIKWKYKTGGKIGSAPAIDNEGIIYFGSNDGYLYALYPNGTRKWRRDVGDLIISSPSFTDEGDIIIGCYDGYVYSFNHDDGVQNWRFEAEKYEFISASASIDNNGIIYIGAGNGWFYALNPNGTLKWKYKTLDVIFTCAAIDENGTIYFGAYTATFVGKLYALEPIDDNAPDKPVINGPDSGLINIEYNYSAVTSDPDYDNISYYFNWGDKSNSGWTDYVQSGTMVNLSHNWENSGTFTIKVKVKDDYGMESEWGELIVTMPKEKALSYSLLHRFLERYPLLNRLLNIFVK
jgi:outer membrane protein assembly factor BamB